MKNKYTQYGNYIDINDYKIDYGSYISSSEYYREIFADIEQFETKEEREIRLSREKAEKRNNKIDKILGL
jgi:hypothetical protein